MSPLRLNGSISGYSEIEAPANAGSEIFTLPGTGGTLDRLNRAGNVLQVVNATYSTSTSNSTTTYADTGLTASITPTSTSSKIIALVNQAGISKTPGNADNAVTVRLLRDGSQIALMAENAAYTATAITFILGSLSICYLDSPNTTSSVVYKTQFKNYVAASSVSVQANSAVSTITLLEVAA